MEEIVASVADLKFEIELQLYNQVGVQPLPFPGMDSTIHNQLMALNNFEITKRLEGFLHLFSVEVEAAQMG